MGIRADRKKSKRFALIAVLLLCFALLLSGCGNQGTAEQTKAGKETTQEKTEAQKQDKSEDGTEEIPSGLLPGQKTDTDKNGIAKNKNTDSMEIVADDGTVYTYEDSSAGDSGTSGSQSTGSGSSANGGTGEAQDGVIRIYFSVDSSNADGSVSFTASMTMDAGATVYDALAASGLSYSGKSYISEIEGLGEKMFGAQSGWKYYVNGSAPGKSCVNYVLKDGDNVQWTYVLKP